MGSDNLFHKRKAKKIGDLARVKARIAPYERILIVCEGEKTEPNYFKEIRKHYELSMTNIEISGESGSSPKTVVNFAKDLFKKSQNESSAFDKVFCVIDRDAHTDFDEAINSVYNIKPKGVFSAIASFPCFEYWLLLHFCYTTKAYENLPDNSSGKQLLSELKAYMPDYEKGKNNVFTSLLGQLEFAKANSKRAMDASESTGIKNPSTQIHELVTYLQAIKCKQAKLK